MELLTLKIENFCSAGLIELPLNQPGLILVTGVNKDAPKASSNGAGKALCLETPLLTSTGWSTVGTIQVGEQVYSPTGESCVVIAKSEIFTNRPTYKITFDDGTHIVCDENHLWKVSENKTRAKAGLDLKNGSTLAAVRDSYYFSGLKTTKQLAQHVLWRAPSKYQYAGHHWAIEQPAPLNFGSGEDPVIPGYILGAWLGDGTSSNGEITSYDQDIIDKIRSVNTKYVISQTPNQVVCHKWRIGKGFNADLRSLGVLGNKHIPLCVLRASVSYRLEVVRGLLDTDGTAGKSGYIEFCVTNFLLAQGFFDLVVSLGMKASFREAEASIYGRYISQRWRIGVWTDDSTVFCLPRKSARISKNKRSLMCLNDRRFIDKIEEVPSVPTQCIQVSAPDGMFLAGRQLVPTHNSIILEALCWCLWGETIRGLSADEVVNTLAEQDCAVTLTLVEQGATYTISRHRQDTRTTKPNDLRILVDGKSLNTSSKLKSTQEIVNQLVGFDFNTFRAMMPGAGIRAASLTDKSIKELLEALLQTEQLSDAHEAAKAKQKALEAKLAQTSAYLVSLKANLISLESDIDHQVKLRDQIKANATQRKNTHLERIGLISSEIAELTAELTKVPELEKTRNQLLLELAGLRATANHAHIEPAKAIQAECDKGLQKQHSKVAVQSALQARLKRSLDQAKSLALTCDACFQPISQERIAEVVTDMNVQYAVSVQEVSAARSAITLLEQTRNAAGKRLAEALQNLQNEAEGLQSAQSLVQQSLAVLGHKKEQRFKALATKASEEQALAAIDLEVYDFDTILAEKLTAAQTVVTAVCETLASAKAAEKELKLCSFWVTGFSPAGLRSFMLDYVTPILNDRAKYYAALLTNQEMSISFSTKSVLKNGTAKDKFAITVSQAHGSSSYTGSSAGEKARADLVIAMALGDLAQLRTSKQLLWRFLDEPFESIDSAGTEAIVKLLHDQKSRYKTVFVVTHKAEFKELFSQSITIVKENGISRLDIGA